jgi:hypothetical protein
VNRKSDNRFVLPTFTNPSATLAHGRAYVSSKIAVTAREREQSKKEDNAFDGAGGWGLLRRAASHGTAQPSEVVNSNIKSGVVPSGVRESLWFEQDLLRVLRTQQQEQQAGWPQELALLSALFRPSPCP